MSENDKAMKKIGLSFGFAKKIESKNLEKSVINETIHSRQETEFVFSLEGKEVHSSKPSKKSPDEFVIPLIQENNWRTPYLDENKANVKSNKKQFIQTENGGSDGLSQQAVKEIIEQTVLQNENWEDRGKPDSSLAVPLLVRNQVPEGFETDDKLDVALRPDGPIEADYEQIPISQFGFAMLRGMGWKDGEGIGKNKELVAPLEATLRPKGMGLGADRSQLAQVKKDEISKNSDREENLDLKKGVCCLIIEGRHKDLYGVVAGMDEDNARVMVKLTLSGSIVTISQFYIDIVSKKDYEKFSKVLNKAKVDKYRKNEELLQSEQDAPTYQGRNGKRHKNSHGRDQSPSRRDKSPHHRKRERKEQHNLHKHKKHRRDISPKQTEMITNKPCSIWIQPDIRVRIVDKKFRNGKYYKVKVVIVDVASHDNCICRTAEGKLLEGLKQTSLETVIPKSDHGHALIVTGKYKGQIGEIMKRSKESCEALLQLLSDRDTVLKLSYDDICEYVGNIEDNFDY